MIELREITVEEAQALIKKSSVTIVDIRDDVSYEDGHIQNAMLLNRQTLDEFVDKTDKARPIICYCYHGNNSKGASLFLQEKGFTEVYSLIGGFEAWQQAFPSESL